MTDTEEYLHGVHTILTTPLTADHRLDEEGLARNVEFGANSNVHALVCLGTQGEFSSFSTAERRRIMEITVQTTAGRKPVVCGTSHSNTQEAMELTQYAAELGADAVLVTPPYFAAVPWAGVHDHFKALSDGADIDIFIYNAPERAGFNTTPAYLVELSKLEHVVGVKQASRNIIELEKTVDVVSGHMAVLGGSEAMMWPCLAMGMRGSSTTAATFMPQYFVDLYDAAVEGRSEDAARLFRDLAPFRRLSERHGHAAVVKAASEMVGLAGGPMRAPLTTPAPGDLSELSDILKQLGVL